MMVVCDVFVGARQVALGADRVAGRPQCQGVRIVAVAAGDSCLVHPALNERTVYVDLFADLTVGEYRPSSTSAEGGFQELDPMTVLCEEVRRAWQRAQFSISRGGSGGELRRAMFSPAPNVHTPASPRAVSRPEFGASCSRPAPASVTWRRPGPWQASQATSISFQGGGVRARFRIVTLRQVRGMAFGAAGVPL